MQIPSLTLPIPGNYPAPIQPRLEQQPAIATPTRNSNVELPQRATVQKEAPQLSADRQSRRDAQPLYDQQLSHRGQRAQQLYTTIEYASDSQVMNRIDEVV